MVGIEQLLSQAWVQRLGWALLHFIWQGLAVAGMLALGMLILRRRSAQARYAVACLALLIMAAAPVATFCSAPLPLLGTPTLPPDSQESSETSANLSGAEADADLTPVRPSSGDIGHEDAAVSLRTGTGNGAEAPEFAGPRTGPGSTTTGTWDGRVVEVLQPLLPCLVTAWMVGVALLSVWHAGGWRRVQRLKRSGLPLGEAGREHAWSEAARRLAERFGLPRPVRLLKSARIAGPVVVGIVRPVVLLPVAMLTGLKPGQIEAILAHELAHIRRHDYLVNLLQSVVETVLFYHPAVWWVSSRIRSERENCCDDLAVHACGGRTTYAHALAALAELSVAWQPKGISRLVAAKRLMPGAGVKVLARVRRIIGLPDSGSAPRWMAGVLVVASLIASGLIIYGSAASGQPPQGPTAPATRPAVEESKEALEARIAELVDRLGSTTFAKREEAQKELVEIGVAAIPALRKAAGGKDSERARRAKAVLVRLTTIAGTVVDEAGEPVKDALVHLLNPRLASAVPRQRAVRYGGFSQLLLPGQTQTDPAGRFTYSDLPDGKTDILVTRGRRLRSASLRNVTVGRVNITVRMGKPRPYRLSGRVLDADGQPVPGASVILIEAAARIPAPPPKLSTVRSDSAGRFRFSEVLRPLSDEDRLYRNLGVSKPRFGFWGKQLDCTGGETDLTIRLAAPSEVKGTVVDAEGGPVAGALVSLWSFKGLHRTATLTADELGGPAARTDATGAFVLRGLPGEGVATIRVACDGYSVERAFGVQLSDSWLSQAFAVQHKAGEPLKVTLRRAAILRGMAVYEGSGRPVAGLTVATQGTKNREWSQTKTRADGTFELPNVTPSPCNVLVLFDQPDKTALPAWAAAAIPIAELKPGQVRKDLKIVLTKGGIIQGKVTDAKGHPLRGINIGFYSAARPRTGGSIVSVDTRGDGTWSCRFPPGPVHMYVQGRNPGLGPWTPDPRDLLLKAGQTLKDIDFRLGVELPEDSPYRAPPPATTPPATQPGAKSGRDDDRPGTAPAPTGAGSRGASTRPAGGSRERPPPKPGADEKKAATAPATEPAVFVLDDCDPDFRGKADYNDNFSCLDGSGKMIFRVGGFNNCGSIGSSHAIAVDARRGWVWVAENVGGRIRKYDFRGKELLVLKDVKSHAIAVQPDTGNLWVLRSSGTIYGESTEVYGPSGRKLASYPFSGFDIAYDRKEKAFWIAAKDLLKVTLDGKVALRTTVAKWCACSVAVDDARGLVWVAVRAHPDVAGSKNKLLSFAADGRLRSTVPLGQRRPFRVAVERRSGTVWVTQMRKAVLMVSADGKQLEQDPLPSLSLDVDGAGNVWVVMDTEVVKLDAKGEVLARSPLRGKTSQAWIATVK